MDTKTLDQVMAECTVEAVDLLAWIDQQWVLPLREGDAFYFNEADVARVELIVDLRERLMVNDEALPLVLGLLDQVYGLRDTLRRVGEAIETLPDADRERLRACLGENGVSPVETP